MVTGLSDAAFEHDIGLRVGKLQAPAPRGLARWSVKQFFWALTIAASLLFLLLNVPNRIFEPDVLHVTIVLGGLGIWRFSWWGVHAVRAEIYQRLKWPGMRAEAEAKWASGWRPEHLNILITTFNEKAPITRRVLRSILSQVHRENIRTTIYIGTGSAHDEAVVEAFIAELGPYYQSDLGGLVDIALIRQNQPGKRMAIGLILRAIRRSGVGPDELVIVMDGDTVLGPDLFAKSLPLFASDPELQALTTNEEVICYGPRWFQSWLDMRFAQRRLAMQSHALSDKVLTLTGRTSVFRTRHILTEDFIRTVEADYLDHWLWGRYRFLSGDDKSTWYHLLAQNAKMTYVPDTMVYTVEIINGSGLSRMIQNCRRWSGNMLRNGSRAIALGPSRVNPFIWWCLVDQRIAMWTMMVNPTLALLVSLSDPGYLWSFLIWVVLTRMVLWFFLQRYGRTINLSWPFILYFNQIVIASVKIYMVFHLAQQNWFNRGNQKSGQATDVAGVFKTGVAKLQMGMAIALFVYLLAWYADV